MQAVQLKHWADLGPAKIMTEAEIRAAGAPVILAGRRQPGAAPEQKELRDQRETKTKKTADPFAKVFDEFTAVPF